MPPKAKKSSKDSSQALNGKGGKPSTPPAPAKAAEAAPDASPQESATKPAAEGFGKPDQAAYNVEQEKLKAEIDAVQAKLSAVKEKISLPAKNGPGNDRRTALRAELDALRRQQSSSKMSRSKLIDQLKQIQDGIQKKGKDLQAARAKAPYKTVVEVDAQVNFLHKQVETGNMKIADEKRALAEISTLKRSRKTVEGFQADQDAIEAERARADELRTQLEDPAVKAASERFDVIRAELDELKKESDEAYAGRTKLFDERNVIQTELDALWTRKRESSQQFREASDKYWQRVNEERARRAEKLKAQRAAEEEEKRREIKERLLEEAKTPAFQDKIEDCQTLIDYFSAKVAGGSAPVPAPTSLSTSKPGLAGVPKLELRQVDREIGQGLVARKKKGEDEVNYFVGNKGKRKKGGGRGGSNNASNASPAGSSSGALNIPFATLSALLELSIPPPASMSDLPRTIEDLRTKKAWFEANQNRVTAENVAKAEAEVQRLTSGSGGGKSKAEPQTTTPTVPLNGVGEKSSPPETSHSVTATTATAVGPGSALDNDDPSSPPPPAPADSPTTSVEYVVVDSKGLEAVKEQQDGETERGEGAAATGVEA